MWWKETRRRFQKDGQSVFAGKCAFAEQFSMADSLTDIKNHLNALSNTIKNRSFIE
jgi:hypothetical protein